jgi:hypothetical protein
MILAMSRRAFASLLFLALVAAAVPRAASASEAAAAKVDRAMDAFWDARYDDALALVHEVLNDRGADAANRADAYKVASCVYVAREALARARGAIVDMFGVDAQARFTPDYRYPPPVITLYHEVRDSLHEGTMDVKTVAIGDFENNSVYTGKFKGYDFGLFRGALVHILTQDLSEATPFRIVDRQRTADLLKEIDLSASQFADPENSVRMGKFLGAHCFIFGQYSVLSRREVRIDARAVHTATGEIILTKSVTGDFSGDPAKFLALEKRLVSELAAGLTQFAERMGESVGDVSGDVSRYFDGRAASVKSRKGYVEAKFLIAEAMEREQASDYAGALERWRSVLETDPQNEVAKVRVLVLAPLVGG